MRYWEEMDVAETAVAMGCSEGSVKTHCFRAVQALSKALKQRGWSFVGPTTAYAFMQAMGLVNDHLDGCAVRTRAQQARSVFQKPH